jgi:MFS family permease
LISFLDRTNIGNAKIEGLQENLNMTDSQYNLSLTIFFISYALFEPLTQILLKRFRPSIFIPVIMFLWGLCMTTMGLVHNFAGLATARWFLGLAEAGLFPGVNYYLSCWYKRCEFGVRAAIFFSAAAVAGSFGGLLAAAIAQMEGVGGKPGWAWIFILEGIATIFVGIISFWVVQDFPDEAKFLSVDDRRRVIRRLKEDKQSSAEHENFKMAYLWASLKDWKTYTGMIVFMGCVSPLYAFSLFVPTIIKDLGYKSTTAQLLSVPPYAIAAVLTVVIGLTADRTGQRGWCNIGVSFLGIIGFGMLIGMFYPRSIDVNSARTCINDSLLAFSFAGTSNPSVQYVGVYLGALGIYPCISNTVSWTANNIEGVYKRGITIGLVVGFGNLNGVVSSNIYRKKDAPRFLPGHGTVLAYMSLFLLGGSVLQRFLLVQENKKRLSGRRDGWIEGKTEAEIENLGDRKPDFIYTL